MAVNLMNSPRRSSAAAGLEAHRLRPPSASGVGAADTPKAYASPASPFKVNGPDWTQGSFSPKKQNAPQVKNAMGYRDCTGYRDPSKKSKSPTKSKRSSDGRRSPDDDGLGGYGDDRIQNELLDEICSDIGIKDSMDLDFLDFDDHGNIISNSARAREDLDEDWSDQTLTYHPESDRDVTLTGAVCAPSAPPGSEPGSIDSIHSFTSSQGHPAALYGRIPSSPTHGDSVCADVRGGPGSPARTVNSPVNLLPDTHKSRPEHSTTLHRAGSVESSLGSPAMKEPPSPARGPIGSVRSCSSSSVPGSPVAPRSAHLANNLSASQPVLSRPSSMPLQQLQSNSSQAEMRPPPSPARRAAVVHSAAQPRAAADEESLASSDTTQQRPHAHDQGYFTSGSSALTGSQYGSSSSLSSSNLPNVQADSHSKVMGYLAQQRGGPDALGKPRPDIPPVYNSGHMAACREPSSPAAMQPHQSNDLHSTPQSSYGGPGMLRGQPPPAAHGGAHGGVQGGVCGQNTVPHGPSSGSLPPDPMAGVHQGHTGPPHSSGYQGNGSGGGDSAGFNLVENMRQKYSRIFNEHGSSRPAVRGGMSGYQQKIMSRQLGHKPEYNPYARTNTTSASRSSFSQDLPFVPNGSGDYQNQSYEPQLQHQPQSMHQPSNMTQPPPGGHMSQQPVMSQQPPGSMGPHGHSVPPNGPGPQGHGVAPGLGGPPGHGAPLGGPPDPSGSASGLSGHGGPHLQMPPQEGCQMSMQQPPPINPVCPNAPTGPHNPMPPHTQQPMPCAQGDVPVDLSRNVPTSYLGHLNMPDDRPQTHSPGFYPQQPQRVPPSPSDAMKRPPSHGPNVYDINSNMNAASESPAPYNYQPTEQKMGIVPMPNNMMPFSQPVDSPGPAVEPCMAPGMEPNSGAGGHMGPPQGMMGPETMGLRPPHTLTPQQGFMQRLITDRSSAFRSHPLFPLLRDLIIADMNFYSPTFPYPLIANLPSDLDHLLQNYLNRNPVVHHVERNEAVDGVIMDALRYAHSSIMEKIAHKKQQEGVQEKANPLTAIEDFCERFDRSVKNPQYGQPPMGRSPSLQPHSPQLPSNALPAGPQTGSVPNSPCKPEKSEPVTKGTGRKHAVLPKESVNVMMEWLREHQDNPYPNDDEKELLIQKTKLTINQINYWFTNARRRILPKWALQRYMQQQQDQGMALPPLPGQLK